MEQLSLTEYQIFWIVGSLERLATLKLLDDNIPLKLPQKSLDYYLFADHHIERLFESDHQMKEAFYSVCSVVEEQDITQLDHIYELLLRYKNDRTDLVKFALEDQFK